jgi:hypothetical protein
MTHFKPSPEPNGVARPEPESALAAPGETVGLQPWYPWPISRWEWWTKPVRAERLAALRIGLSAWLLFDVLTTYLPNVQTFYGANSLGEPPIYDWMWTEKRWAWSVFYGVQDHTYLFAGMIVWIIAIVGLLTGCFTRVSAVVTFVLSTSFANLNYNVDNAGDTVRGIILFYLAISMVISPSGAVWSVDAWRARRTGPTFIDPWALRLLFLQMILIYWANGMHKIVGHDWQHGDSLYYVLGDATLTRWSAAQFQLPYWLTRLLTWTVLTWEVSLPALLLADAVLTRWAKASFCLPFLGPLCTTTRSERGWKVDLQAFLSLHPLAVVTLCFGALFHIGIWITLELGFFPPYMLCLYLPLLPWERWADRWRARD